MKTLMTLKRLEPNLRSHAHFHEGDFVSRPLADIIPLLAQRGGWLEHISSGSY